MKWIVANFDGEQLGCSFASKKEAMSQGFKRVKRVVPGMYIVDCWDGSQLLLGTANPIRRWVEIVFQSQAFDLPEDWCFWWL